MDDETGIDEISHAPVVRLLNSIFRQAIKVKAGDIHIEPFKNYVRIRFRIDGELQEILSLHIATHSAILTRVKIMGRLNIAEKRIPKMEESKRILMEKQSICASLRFRPYMGKKRSFDYLIRRIF